MKRLSIYRCHTLPLKLKLPSLEDWAVICEGDFTDGIFGATGYAQDGDTIIGEDRRLWDGFLSNDRQYFPSGQFLFVSKGIKYKSVNCVCEAASKSSVEEEYKIDRALVVDIGSSDLSDGSDVLAVLGTCRIYPRHFDADDLTQPPKPDNFCDLPPAYQELHYAPLGSFANRLHKDKSRPYCFAYQPLIYYWKDQFWTDAVDNLNCPATHKVVLGPAAETELLKNLPYSESYLRSKQYSIIYPLTNEKNDG